MSDLGSECGLRRDPFLLLLFGLIVQCFLLPSVSAGCQGIEGLSLSIYPEGTIKLPYGNPLEIFCVGQSYDSDDIEFQLIGNTLSSEKVNSTTRRLYVERPERGIHAYYCVNKKSKKICPTRVLIDSAPRGVKDFSCISKNIDELTCTWTDENITVVNYLLSFIIPSTGRKADPCTPKKGTSKTYFCSWSVNRVPRYRQLEKTYYFSLTSTNAFGSIEQSFTVDHFSVVQPAPVLNLKVIEVGRYSVLLQWNLPINMVDFLPNGVEHKIEYNVAKIDNTTFFRSVDTSSLRTKNKTCRFLLSLPYAHMRYEVRVYIRPVQATGDEFWSHFSYVVFETTGKSVNEINKMIYFNWRRSMKKPSLSFRRKMWHMNAQKKLKRIWLQKNRAASALGFRFDAVGA